MEGKKDIEHKRKESVSLVFSELWVNKYLSFKSAKRCSCHVA